MNERQFEKIEEGLGEINNNLEEVNDNLNYTKVILTILIVLILAAMVTLILSKYERLPSLEDYCDYHFGEGYYYNRQGEELYQVRSCDYIERNGNVEQKFFSMDEYNFWRKRK